MASQRGHMKSPSSICSALRMAMKGVLAPSCQAASSWARAELEPGAELFDLAGLELLAGEQELELHLDPAPAPRPRPTRQRGVAAAYHRGKDRHLEQLEELGGRGHEGEGRPVPGLLPLGEDAHDAPALAYDLHGPVDRLHVGYGLRFGYGADEAEEGPHDARAHIAVARDPVDGLAEEGGEDEGVEDRDVVGDYYEGRREAPGDIGAPALDPEVRAQP
jgi:hypothetical protein